MDPSYREPRSVGGIVVYLLAFPVVGAALAAPGLFVPAAMGAVTALVVQKLRRRRRRTSAETRSSTAVPQASRSP